MAKIISYPIKRYEPIKCVFCGTEYEYEKGDRIFAQTEAENEYYNRLVDLYLQCPVCHMGNKLVERRERNDGTR